MFKEKNLNPSGKRTGDCVVRAIAYATGSTWERTYLELTMEGYEKRDMPSSNAVWDISFCALRFLSIFPFNTYFVMIAPPC